MADIKGLHDPDLPFLRILYWGFIVVTLSALVTALLLFWRRRQARKSTGTALVPGRSQEEHWSLGAISRLQDLAHESDDFERMRQQVFVLSALMRELLEHLTSQSVTELTRSEIALRISPTLEPALGQRINEFFLLAELIQFARQSPPTGRYAQEHTLVREVLNLAMEHERQGLQRKGLQNETGSRVGGQTS